MPTPLVELRASSTMTRAEVRRVVEEYSPHYGARITNQVFERPCEVFFIEVDSPEMLLGWPEVLQSEWVFLSAKCRKMVADLAAAKTPFTGKLFVVVHHDEAMMRGAGGDEGPGAQ